MFLLFERPVCFGERGGLGFNLRLIGVALRPGLVQFLRGNHPLIVAQLFAAGVFGFGKREIGFRLRQIIAGLAGGIGLGTAFQLKQPLPGFDLVAARHGQILKRAAQRRRHINVFALDVALKLVRRIR